jgi:hypothetical protein
MRPAEEVLEHATDRALGEGDAFSPEQHDEFSFAPHRIGFAQVLEREQGCRGPGGLA